MRRYKIIEDGIIPHFATWTLTEWLPIFISDKYCDILKNSLEYCRREKGLLVHAYVIMPTHAHFILSVEPDFVLSDVLRDARKFTAKEIVRQLQQDEHRLFEWIFREAAQKVGRPKGSYKVWSEGTHPVALESEQMAIQRFEYLHNNPVRKGLVEFPEYWRYSSASFYLTEKEGPIQIDPLDW